MIPSPSIVVPLAASLLVLAGCAGRSSEPAGGETALDTFTTDTIYVRTDRCLSTFDYDVVEVIDERHLLFRDSRGSELWVNRLRHRCTGLRPSDRLALEIRGTRVCATDTARIVRLMMFGSRTGPSCSLGEFQELTPAQALLLKAGR